MSKIEDRLWTDLVAEPQAESALSARQPLPMRGHSRRVALAATGLVLTGLIVTMALATGGTQTTPAYAVTVNANGSVRVTLNEVLGVSGANEQLASLGVRARIARVEAGCTETAENAIPPGDISNGRIPMMVEPQKVGEGLAGLDWVIHPDAIPQGDTVLITAQLANAGRPVATYQGKAISAVGSSVSLYRGAAPTCRPPATFYPG